MAVLTLSSSVSDTDSETNAKTIRYAEIVKHIIREHAVIPVAVGEVRFEVVFDDTQGHYELMASGWVPPLSRVHGAILHLDVRDGKVWIEHDGTSRGVADELIEAGIPMHDIVLAFQPPYARPYTGFAVG